MRTVAEERAVLGVLAEAGEDLMTLESALWREAQQQVSGPLTRADLTVLLERLETAKQIIGISGRDGTRWKITALGMARHVEAKQ